MQCTMTPSIRYHKIPLWSNKDIRKTAHDNYTQSESVIKQILPLWVSCSQPAAAAQYISRESHFDTSSRVTKTWSTQAVSGRQKTAMHRHGSCIDYSLKFRQVTSTFIYTTTIQVTWLVVTEVRSESFGLVTERHHYNARPICASCSYVAKFYYSSLSAVSSTLSAHVHAMQLLDVRASSSPSSLRLWQILFLWWPLLLR